MANTQMMYTKSAVDLRMDMRKPWEDYLVYTHDFIVSSVAGLDDTGKVAEQPLRNQDEIGAAIAPLYGDAAGQEKWQKNADEIASFEFSKPHPCVNKMRFTS